MLIKLLVFVTCSLQAPVVRALTSITGVFVLDQVIQETTATTTQYRTPHPPLPSTQPQTPLTFQRIIKYDLSISCKKDYFGVFILKQHEHIFFLQKLI